MYSSPPGSLALPLPLRPEQRLGAFVATLQDKTMSATAPHPFVDALITAAAQHNQPWLMQSPPGSHTRASMAADLTSLPIHTRTQLRQLDEEALRLHALHNFFAPFAHSSGHPSTVIVAGERASISSNGGRGASSPLTSAAASPMSPPPLVRPTSASMGKMPPPLPTTSTAQAAHIRCDSPGCGLLAARLLLSCRLPDFLLRLLKWLNQSDANLMQQRSNIVVVQQSSSTTILAQQIDRIRAHFALMEEMSWKILWRIEQLIRSGLLSTCVCALPVTANTNTNSGIAAGGGVGRNANDATMFAHWWSYDALSKVQRILASSELRLGHTTLFSFVDLMMGDNDALFTMQAIMGPTTPAPSSSSSSSPLSPQSHHRPPPRSLKLRAIADVDMFPHLLSALSQASTPALAHEVLELLSMLLIRHQDNAVLILRQGSWQAPLVPLLLTSGVAEGATVLRPRLLAARTLNEIINKELQQASSAATAGGPSAPPKRRASFALSQGTDMAQHQQQSPEALLASNLRLSLNLWVLLHYTALSSDESFSTADAPSSSSSSSSSSSGAGTGPFFALLSHSLDALEDVVGWLPHTILLVRVLLLSLLTKVSSAVSSSSSSSTSALRRTLKLDPHHPAWHALFDLMAAVENFVFYSPLVAGSSAGAGGANAETGYSPTAIEAAQEQARAAQVFEFFSRINFSGGVRRHASAIAASTSNSSSSSSAAAGPVVVTENQQHAYLARAPASRRFKLVGVHLSTSHANVPRSDTGGTADLGGTSPAVSNCEDEGLVQKALEVLDSLRAVADQLQSGTCSSGSLGGDVSGIDAGDELVERERIKRIRKRLQDEQEFFRATLAYLQQCSSASSPEPVVVSSPTSPPPSATTPWTSSSSSRHSMPALLERRRHARQMSGHGGGHLLSGMLHGLTRGRRLRSMEAKLQGFVSEAAAVAAAAARVSNNTGSGIGRTLRTAQRSPGGRIKFHDTVHTKVNVELALLKIEAHYVPHKQQEQQQRRRRASSFTMTQHPAPSPTAGAAVAAAIAMPSGAPPPIPARPRLKLDLPRSPRRRGGGTGGPLSPSNWTDDAEHHGLPLSPRRIKSGRTYTNLRPLPVPPSFAAASKAARELNEQAGNVAGPIVASPRHSGPHALEPKEGGEEHDQSIKAGDVAHIGAEEDQPGLPCCSCSNPIVAEQELWHGALPYCRHCFLRTFCACTRCAWVLRGGETFVLLSGLEPEASMMLALQQRVAPHDEDELIQLRSQEGFDEGDPDTLIYHVACLACQAPEHRSSSSRSSRSSVVSSCGGGGSVAGSRRHSMSISAASSGMDDALEELEEARWFQHKGLILCAEHYLAQHGESCAQCKTLIRSGLVRALGRSWHASCFLCAGDCGRALSNGGGSGEQSYFIAPDSFLSAPSSPTTAAAASTHADPSAPPAPQRSPRQLAASLRANKSAFCFACFQRLFVLCHFCSEAIEEEEQGSAVMVKHAAGRRRKPYHARCYQCVVCLQLRGPDEKLYAADDEPNGNSGGSGAGGKLYCFRHYTERFFPSCPTCHQPVLGDEEEEGVGNESGADAPSSTMSVNGVEYHRACVRCAVSSCRAELTAPGADVYARLVPDSSASPPATNPNETEEEEEELEVPMMQILLCTSHRHLKSLGENETQPSIPRLSPDSKPLQSSNPSNQSPPPLSKQAATSKSMLPSSKLLSDAVSSQETERNVSFATAMASSSPLDSFVKPKEAMTSPPSLPAASNKMLSPSAVRSQPLQQQQQPEKEKRQTPTAPRRAPPSRPAPPPPASGVQAAGPASIATAATLAAAASAQAAELAKARNRKLDTNASEKAPALTSTNTNSDRSSGVAGGIASGCPQCNKPLKSGRPTLQLGTPPRSFHVFCAFCATCRVPLAKAAQGKEFALERSLNPVDGKLYCLAHLKSFK